MYANVTYLYRSVDEYRWIPVSLPGLSKQSFRADPYLLLRRVEDFLRVEGLRVEG